MYLIPVQYAACNQLDANASSLKRDPCLLSNRQRNGQTRQRSVRGYVVGEVVLSSSILYKLRPS